nr:zinc knuckle CX2CX4HX4C [Tanacetum cinerariifolium]
MEDDLFVYELEVFEDFYLTCIEQPPDNLKNEKRLDIKFRDHKKVDKEILEKVVSIWLIRSYKNQFEEYMEIKRGLEESLCEDTKIFRIEKDIYDLESPLCKEFKEFSHILQIDVDVLIRDSPRFKTYEDYKNAWIYEWNKEVLWVKEKPWLYEGLENGDLKDEALKEKTILEGSWGHKNRKGKNFCSWLKECFEEEIFMERKSKLLGMPYEKSPTLKSEKFKFYYKGKHHGEYIHQSIDEGPFKMGWCRDEIALGNNARGPVTTGNRRAQNRAGNANAGQGKPINNWAKHGLKRIMMNTKGFFFKFDSRAGLETVLEGGPWLIYVVTISVPLLMGDDFTRETIYVDYEWKPPRCDKKRKGKSKSTNGAQFTGPLVKQNVRYEPKAAISVPKKGVTNVGNPSNLSSKLRNTGTSFNKDSITSPNSFSALNIDEGEEEDITTLNFHQCNPSNKLDVL